jgi:hypothetical protein
MTEIEALKKREELDIPIDIPKTIVYNEDKTT